MPADDLPPGCPWYGDGPAPQMSTLADVQRREDERRRAWERSIPRPDYFEVRAEMRNAMARTDLVDGEWVTRPKTKAGERRIANGEDPYDVYSKYGKGKKGGASA